MLYRGLRGRIADNGGGLAVLLLLVQAVTALSTPAADPEADPDFGYHLFNVVLREHILVNFAYLLLFLLYYVAVLRVFPLSGCREPVRRENVPGRVRLSGITNSSMSAITRAAMESSNYWSALVPRLSCAFALTVASMQLVLLFVTIWVGNYMDAVTHFPVLPWWYARFRSALVDVPFLPIFTWHDLFDWSLLSTFWQYQAVLCQVTLALILPLAYFFTETAPGAYFWARLREALLTTVQVLILQTIMVAVWTLGFLRLSSQLSETWLYYTWLCSLVLPISLWLIPQGLRIWWAVLRTLPLRLDHQFRMRLQRDVLICQLRTAEHDLDKLHWRRRRTTLHKNSESTVFLPRNGSSGLSLGVSTARRLTRRRGRGTVGHLSTCGNPLPDRAWPAPTLTPTPTPVHSQRHSFSFDISHSFGLDLENVPAHKQSLCGTVQRPTVSHYRSPTLQHLSDLVQQSLLSPKKPRQFQFYSGVKFLDSSSRKIAHPAKRTGGTSHALSPTNGLLHSFQIPYIGPESPSRKVTPKNLDLLGHRSLRKRKSQGALPSGSVNDYALANFGPPTWECKTPYPTSASQVNLRTLLVQRDQWSASVDPTPTRPPPEDDLSLVGLSQRLNATSSMLAQSYQNLAERSQHLLLFDTQHTQALVRKRTEIQQLYTTYRQVESLANRSPWRWNLGFIIAVTLGILVYGALVAYSTSSLVWGILDGDQDLAMWVQQGLDNSSERLTPSVTTLPVSAPYAQEIWRHRPFSSRHYHLTEGHRSNRVSSFDSTSSSTNETAASHTNRTSWYHVLWGGWIRTENTLANRVSTSDSRSLGNSTNHSSESRPFPFPFPSVNQSQVVRSTSIPFAPMDAPNTCTGNTVPLPLQFAVTTTPFSTTPSLDLFVSVAAATARFYVLLSLTQSLLVVFFIALLLAGLMALGKAVRRVEQLWDGASSTKSDALAHCSIERQLVKRYFLFPNLGGLRIRGCLVYLMGTTLLTHVLPTLARVLGLISPTVWRLSTQSLATSPYRWLAASQTWQSLLRLSQTVFGILYDWWVPVDPSSAQSFRQVYLASIAKLAEWGQRVSLQVTQVWESPEIQLIRYTLVRGSDWILHLLYYRVPRWYQRQCQTFRRVWRVIQYTYQHVLSTETMTLPRSWWTRCRALWITMLLMGSWSVREPPGTLSSSSSVLPSLSASYYHNPAGLSTPTGTQCPWHRVFGAPPYPRTASTYVYVSSDSFSHSTPPIPGFQVTGATFAQSVIDVIETQDPADLDLPLTSENETTFPSHIFHPLQNLLYARLPFHSAAWSVWWHWYTGRINSPAVFRMPHPDLTTPETIICPSLSLRFQMDQGYCPVSTLPFCPADVGKPHTCNTGYRTQCRRMPNYPCSEYLDEQETYLIDSGMNWPRLVVEKLHELVLNLGNLSPRRWLPYFEPIARPISSTLYRLVPSGLGNLFRVTFIMMRNLMGGLSLVLPKWITHGMVSPSIASPPSTIKLHSPALNLAIPLQSQVCHRLLPPSPPPPVPLSFFLDEFGPSEVSVPTDQAERVYYYYYYLAYYQVYYTWTMALTRSLHYKIPQGQEDPQRGQPLYTAHDSEWQALLQDDHFGWGDPS
ncbi:hypothetical protein IWQ61_009235, partial [Dispira simplex]